MKEVSFWPYLTKDNTNGAAKQHHTHTGAWKAAEYDALTFQDDLVFIRQVYQIHDVIY